MNELKVKSDDFKVELLEQRLEMGKWSVGTEQSAPIDFDTMQYSTQYYVKYEIDLF